MRILITTLLLLAAKVCLAQRPQFAFSLSAGSDLNSSLTAMGINAGFYTSNRAHALMVTLEADGIYNKALLHYNRPNRVHPDIALSVASSTIGLQYVGRLVNLAPVSLATVVQPWYSINLRLPSAWAGGRLTWAYGTGTIAAEVVRDPFGRRTMLRFVFTTLGNKR